MNNEELTDTVNALYDLCMVQAGRIEALEVMHGAVVASLGVSLPPLIDQIAQHAKGLSSYRRDLLEPASLEVFDSTLHSFAENLEALGK